MPPAPLNSSFRRYKAALDAHLSKTMALMKTANVRKLVNEALDSLPRPYTEDIIDDVFFAIEQNPKWRKEYASACDDLGNVVVNTWGGYWIANALGKVGERQASSRKSTLIASYSILDADAKPVTKKPKQAEAVQMMADYYQAHKTELPPTIKEYREPLLSG
jgi:hypothetical protein